MTVRHLTSADKLNADGTITIAHGDPRIRLYEPEEVAAAVRAIGNRRRRRIEAANLRRKSRV